MSQARCIGRGGRFAFALGLGAAVGVVTAATAAAAPSDTSDTSQSSMASAGSAGPARPASGGVSAKRFSAPNSVAAQRLAVSYVAPATPAPPRPGLIMLAANSGRRDHLGSPRRGAVPVAGAAQQAAASDDQSPNLLVNPGAEFGDPSLAAYSSVTLPGWQVQGTPTVIQYGTARRPPSFNGVPSPAVPFPAFPIYGNATLVTPAGSGKQFFGGGPVADSSMSQKVDLTGAQADIDAGGVSYNLGASLGGAFFDFSRTEVEVNFLDGNGDSLGAGTLQTVTPFNRGLVTGFIQRNTAGTIPVGTRSAVVTVTFDDRNAWLGNYNNAYADNISFTIGADLAAPGDPTVPESTVGDLDHVFMVYMENKGFDDIVGSPNAPYLNSLIDTYGFASNYYALSHPSAPNYYPILGGSDFGTNFNCLANCFDARNLTENLADAGKTWASYQANGGGYNSFSPFLTFAGIYNDPDVVDAHLRPLDDMASGLADPSSAPNFVWFFPDEETNMEGPLSSPLDLIRWAVSLLTTHQYNIKAGDKWLQETIPVILDSPTWLDPTQKSAIFLSFDEDSNNTSLGAGNEGNHVVTVVIPSPGAITAGMRSGSFASDTYYNHYSLLRTIEESLGVLPLTNNDKYAQPMNDFWN